jgi:hypothetical protein
MKLPSNQQSKHLSSCLLIQYQSWDLVSLEYNLWTRKQEIAMEDGDNTIQEEQQVPILQLHLLLCPKTDSWV